MPESLHSKRFARLRRQKIIFELIILTIVAAVVISAVHEFLLQPFITSGDSMAPTFRSGEYLVIDELYYRFHKPARGDTLVFRYPQDPSVFFIKRLAGVPGDTIDGVSLGPDEYFVLGDNRNASFDSRVWGPVPARYIIGRPILRLYPFTQFAILPGESSRAAFATSTVQMLSTGKTQK